MAKSVNVNGEALHRVALPGGSLADLGYSLNGCRIEFRRRTFDVMADTGGGDDGVPVDVQSMGRIAIIRSRLVVYDDAILDGLQRLADETNLGELESIGYLLGANAKFSRLLITSPLAAKPWNFPTGHLIDATEVEIGTKRTAWDIVFRAIAYIGAGTSLGKVLFNRVTT